MKIILFTDIDGVLLPYQYGKSQLQAYGVTDRNELVTKLITEQYQLLIDFLVIQNFDIHIVISSSWRFNLDAIEKNKVLEESEKLLILYNKEEIKNLFSLHDFAKYILDRTLNCLNDYPNTSNELLRSEEIDKWLQDNNETNTLHLIFDDIQLGRWHKRHFVHCFPYEGLTESTVGVALHTLQHQLDKKNNNSNKSQTSLLDQYQAWLIERHLPTASSPIVSTMQLNQLNQRTKLANSEYDTHSNSASSISEAEYFMKNWLKYNGKDKYSNSDGTLETTVLADDTSEEISADLIMKSVSN